MSEVDGSTHYRVNEPSVIHQAIDGELVIIHLDRGLYYSLDSTGARIWAALAAGQAAGSVVDDLASDAGAPTAEVTAAVAGLIDELATEELLVPAAAPATQDRAGSPTQAHAAHNGRGQPARATSGTSAFAAPVLQRYDDLQDLLLLDPIHAVDESGWPERRDGS